MGGLCGDKFVRRGVDTGRLPGEEELPSGLGCSFGVDAVGIVGVASDWAEAGGVESESGFLWPGGSDNLDASSKAPKDEKSVSLRAGAGADGEMLALSDIVIGGLDCKLRLGASEARDGGAWLSFLLPRLPFSLPPPAATWAAFLFFLSMVIGWPGRM